MMDTQWTHDVQHPIDKEERAPSKEIFVSPWVFKYMVERKKIPVRAVKHMKFDYFKAFVYIWAREILLGISF